MTRAVLSALLLAAAAASLAAAQPVQPAGDDAAAAQGQGAQGAGGNGGAHEVYACVDCDDMDPRMHEFCREVVDEGQPCAAYRLVWRRLCRRTCFGVNRNRCNDVERVCAEDPDCGFLCTKFFNHLCPDTEPAANLVRHAKLPADPCPGTPLPKADEHFLG